MIEPNTPEWFEARCGRLTASRVYDATARTKRGEYYAARAAYLVELATERLTGSVAMHYVSPAMQWGTDHEPFARAAYEYLRNAEVLPVGFVQHPELPASGATPDGQAGAVLVEFKCPTSATHTETLLTGEIDARYIAQIEWQLACCPWCDACDFVSFDPRFPPELRLWVKRVARDADAIAAREIAVSEFLAELDTLEAQLREAGRTAHARIAA
jgi:hypothetical protein